MTERLDVIVIGGGLVGLATARACALSGRDVVLIERNTRLASETSARNSEVIHAGLYYPENSLKARMCRSGNAQLYRYCAERGVATKRCGKLIVATTPGEVAALQRLMRHAETCGVNDLIYLDAHEARAREPELSCEASCLSPSTGVVDVHGLATALETDLLDCGVTIALQTTVVALSNDGDVLTVMTRDCDGQTSHFKARTVVNAAGFGAEEISATLRSASKPPPETYFGKGHYFDYTGPVPFSHLIYPMPTADALGIHLTRGIDGAVKFGPDLTWVDTLDYGFDDNGGARHAHFTQAIKRYWPNLDPEKMHPGMTGLRPKIAAPGAPAADFAVHDKRVHGIPGYVALYGIESPGLTASLPLGNYVASVANSRQ